MTFWSAGGNADMRTLILTNDDVRRLMNMAEAIQVVETAFADWTRGKGSMPGKSYLISDGGDFRAMPAALPGAVGIKWANVHPQNPRHHLPTVMAVMVLNDPATGYPLAVMDATEITAYRTGAAAAVASKHLARSASRSLGIIGAGRQAHTQILAHAELFDVGVVKVFDEIDAAVDKLIESFPERRVMACSLEEALASDIVCTLTPSRRPFVKRDWVLPGTHINAIGADAEGKQELESAILREATVVVDDPGQAAAGGEINVSLREGVFRIEDVHATLGEVIAGIKKGRLDEKEITVFDSTGLAIEDVAVAGLLYGKARRKGGYRSIDLVGAGNRRPRTKKGVGPEKQQ
jgi:alanine dehydrogenase